MADNDTENLMTEDGADETVERSRLALLGGLSAAATTGGCTSAYGTYSTYSEPDWGLGGGGGDSERDRDDDEGGEVQGDEPYSY